MIPAFTLRDIHSHLPCELGGQSSQSLLELCKVFRSSVDKEQEVCLHLWAEQAYCILRRNTRKEKKNVENEDEDGKSYIHTGQRPLTWQDPTGYFKFIQIMVFFFFFVLTFMFVKFNEYFEWCALLKRSDGEKIDNVKLARINLFLWYKIFFKKWQ